MRVRCASWRAIVDCSRCLAARTRPITWASASISSAVVGSTGGAARAASAAWANASAPLVARALGGGSSGASGALAGRRAITASAWFSATSMLRIAR